jgi:hypothetical protein
MAIALNTKHTAETIKYTVAVVRTRGSGAHPSARHEAVKA